MNRTHGIRLAGRVALLGLTMNAAWGVQPRVRPADHEPDWADLLKHQWGLDLVGDLRNPWHNDAAPAARFVRVDGGKPVVLTPLIALGLETPVRAGIARPGAVLGAERPAVVKQEAWSYAFKHPHTAPDATFEPVPLKSGSTQIDTGDDPFVLWVSNDGLDDGGVFTAPELVAAVNRRLKDQPYKAMIYPFIDRAAGRPVVDSYLVGWEYSDNDDFQDVVVRIDNVRLLPAEKLPGIVDGEPQARRLARGFAFSEGPAWDRRGQALYFSDIPRAQILRFAGGDTAVANAESGQSNGLMFDAAGELLACEHRGRRVSRARPGEPGRTIVDRYEGRRLNSPNDLWIDAAGGFYFTDPRYGGREDLEQDVEAVYYVDRGGSISRIIGDLVRPNGIALAPDGRHLYVVDNGADSLWRYPVEAPGRIGPGRRIAWIPHPDGMTVDARGRLYVTGREGVAVLEPGGRWIGVIGVAEQPANCTFGGPDQRVLYITARTSLYGIETLTRGWHIHLDGPPAAGR